VHSTIEQLQQALNRHDADAVAALFAPDYHSEQPAHPNRGFAGRAQVAVNWSGMFSGVPDFEAGVVKESTDGAVSWSEWVWRGTRTDGDPFLMRGVIVMHLHEHGLIGWARLYMEPVEQGGAAIDESVRQLTGSR
jgi:ketosteroid isomerase-like protein